VLLEEVVVVAVVLLQREVWEVLHIMVELELEPGP
jgi:hypothetical protein